MTSRAVFTHTHYIIILLILLVYSVQVVSFTLLLSQFFSKRNLKILIQNIKKH